MKIVTVASLHGNGGAERQIIMLSNALVDRGHDVTLIALAECNLCFELSSRVKLIDLSGVEKNKGNKIVNRFIAYRRMIKGIMPDVSVHYFFQSAYFSVVLPKKRRGKIIYSERGDPYDSEFSGALGVIRWLADFFIDGFVFQSKGAQFFFSDKIKARSVIIPNSVSITNIEEYPVQTVREKRIVSIGRLHPQKNFQLLLEAFSKIAFDFPEYQLEIYGDGEQKEELIALSEKLGLSERVHFIPPQRQIFKLIYKASLFVLTSNFEGMPNALMEAMALGLPCVSTDCRPGGARDLIKDNENGFIVPVGDVKTLSNRIAFVLEHPLESGLIAAKARNIINTHTPERSFGLWEDFIKKVTNVN